MTGQPKPQPRFEEGSKVKIVAGKDEASRHAEGKTGRVTTCKPSERSVAYLYDVVLDGDETTLEMLPESCLEKAK